MSTAKHRETSQSEILDRHILVMALRSATLHPLSVYARIVPQHVFGTAGGGVSGDLTGV